MKLKTITHPAVAHALLPIHWTRAELDHRGLRVYDALSGEKLNLPLPNATAALHYTAQVIGAPLELLNGERGGPEVNAKTLKDRHGRVQAVVLQTRS